MWARSRSENYRLCSERPFLQGGIERADALRYTVFAATISEFLHGNTNIVEYSRAGEARIACEVSPARMGPAVGTPPRDSLSETGRNLFPCGRGGLSK